MDTKTCRKCGIPKSLDEFPKAARCKGGRSARCRTCKSARMKEYRHRKIAEDPIGFRQKENEKSTAYGRKHPEKTLLSNARARARKENLPFLITEQDVVIPTYCPALNLELKRGVKKLTSASPTLDKVIPSLGYVPGNVAVISHRANKLKNDATFEEVAGLYRWWSSIRKSDEIADIHNQGKSSNSG